MLARQTRISGMEHYSMLLVCGGAPIGSRHLGGADCLREQRDDRPKPVALQVQAGQVCQHTVHLPAHSKRWHAGRLDRVDHLFGCAAGRAPGAGWPGVPAHGASAHGDRPSPERRRPGRGRDERRAAAADGSSAATDGTANGPDGRDRAECHTRVPYAEMPMCLYVSRACLYGMPICLLGMPDGLSRFTWVCLYACGCVGMETI